MPKEVSSHDRWWPYLLVKTDDGREAVLYGGCSRGEENVTHSIMFANGSTILDVEEERLTIVKRFSKMGGGGSTKKDEFPEPWKTAMAKWVAYCAGHGKVPKAKPLPPASAEVQALMIDARMGRVRQRERRWRVAKIRAWRCRDEPEELVTQAHEADVTYLYGFEKWAWLKKAAPDSILFLSQHLEYDTYHLDAREVKRFQHPGRYRHVTPHRLANGWDWPLVLGYASRDWEETVLDLLAEGATITLVEPDRHWRQQDVWKITRFDDYDATKAGFEAETARHAAKARQQERSKKIEKTVKRRGGAQLDMFDEPLEVSDGEDEYDDD